MPATATTSSPTPPVAIQWCSPSDIARADVKISRDGSSLIIQINDDQRITYQNQFLNLATTDQRLDYVKFADGTNVWVGGFVGRYQVATAGNDLRLGSAAWDSMWGLGGTDILQGFAGDDEMWGGLGDDIVDGGVGNDKVYGDAGKDRLYGGLGNDIAFGGDGDDKIWGNEGNDTIYGGAGNDIISAYLGDDLIYGDAGNDSIDGSYGIDTLDYSAATAGDLRQPLYQGHHRHGLRHRFRRREPDRHQLQRHDGRQHPGQQAERRRWR